MPAEIGMQNLSVYKAQKKTNLSKICRIIQSGLVWKQEECFEVNFPFPARAYLAIFK